MHVKARQKMYYQRREYDPGEIYEMDDREAMEANLLCLLGKIELVKDYRTAEAEPVPPEAHDTSEDLDQPDKKRSYRRRDMRPEK